MPRTKPTPRFRTIAEVIERLGGVPAWRICADPPPGRATRKDLVRLHAREDKLYELVDGTLVEKPMGSPESYLAAELLWRFRAFLERHDLGFLYAPDALVEVMPELVRGPDVSFVPWTKRPEKTVPREPISDLIPDLAVEVLSPNNTRGEILRKLKEYFLGGVRLVWVIDPRTMTAAVYTAPDEKTTIDESGTLDGGDVLPGFRLPLAKLFERLEKPKPKKRKN